MPGRRLAVLGLRLPNAPPCLMTAGSGLPDQRHLGYRLGCEQLNTQFVEVAEIAGCEHEIARQADGGDQSIHRAEPAAGARANSRQQASATCSSTGTMRPRSAPAAPLEATDPILRRRPRSQPLDPETDLGEADDAEEDPTLIHLVEPAHAPCAPDQPPPSRTCFASTVSRRRRLRPSLLNSSHWSNRVRGCSGANLSIPNRISVRLTPLRKMRSSSDTSSQLTIAVSDRGLIHSDTTFVSISRP